MGMRRGSVCLSIAALAGLFAPSARAARDGAPAVLPLRAVVLYESGVGYFERRGPVQRNAPLDLLVPQNHLDDALMTLVVLTTDGARVGAMTFPSVLAPEAALAESPASFDLFSQEGSLLPLLTAMAGLQASLVTTDGERLSGRVVGVARVEEPAPEGEAALAAPDTYSPAQPGMLQVPVLVFLREDGSLRWFHLEQIESIGPADGPAQTALDRAVAATSQRRGEAQEAVGVSVREGGDLAIGYLAEAPVWPVSYRLVFQEGRGRMQGWALVHNDTDEDWANIGVELVEGQPTSYLFPFVTPRFRHRDVLAAEEGLETAPQLAGTNADQLAAGGSSIYGFGLGGVGMMGHGYGTGGGYGYAAGGGSFGEGLEGSQLLAVGEMATAAMAAPEQRRELLSYRATEPLSLRAHESALVPVIDAPISAERISVVDPSQNVLAALKVRNDTGYALREGPLAVFDAGFAGETWLPRMYVDDARILPHGADLDVVASVEDSSSKEEPRIVRWYRMGSRDSGTWTERLEEHYYDRRSTTYRLESHAATDRKVCIRVEQLTNGRITSEGSAELLTAEDGADYYHVCVALPAGEEVLQEIATEEGLVRHWAADGLTSAVLAGLAADEAFPEAVRAVLAEAKAALEESEAAINEALRQQQDAATISSEIARHRADLAALAGSGADEDVATDLAERMIEAGQRLDRTVADAAAARARSAAAHERALEILRALEPPA